ncbi:hypothetical protein FOPG_17646 [Fusarium oxysporum f. sp. conglutinans race 2 54008]|uniref:Heterokaryon incompatibility domain-containing protein n=1 Tax=Fusarium oxysporum f. sp. conglutinans race 2 54008 TaxID=1089457 RepID=X0H276_FUSOX|nr:hypothetical protein FOPG_17646 [Fusarium oxysporum f. sp. conglutinans race 2 54008]
MGRYIALSHRWDSGGDVDRFCTYNRNVDDYHKKIDLCRLPKTFQDAITITRELKIRFLWIDSLCIVQDDGLDWKREAALMGAVFSSAYCTLAGTSAQDSTEGLLNTRSERPCIMMSASPGRHFYICESIDDFHRDVEEGLLNTRGWVMQERALSHRTIHFTKTQTYWECGEGIRCETLAKMQNSKAAFFSDPQFPQSALKYLKDGRIRLFEMLYERYSRLNLTMASDRSVAIAGLEQRLLETFNCKGGYGVFERYLHRSLLWQRAGERMQCIRYPTSRPVPTWSWMAWMGPISYVDVPFEKVDWSDNIGSPFENDIDDGSKGEVKSISHIPEIKLNARAKEFTLEEYQDETLVLDSQTWQDLRVVRCVVIGVERSNISVQERKHYVILIAPKNGCKTFERVGAGFLNGKYISSTTAIEVQIV